MKYRLEITSQGRTMDGGTHRVRAHLPTPFLLHSVTRSICLRKACVALSVDLEAYMNHNSASASSHTLVDYKCHTSIVE
jgi:hypothetical protein